METAGNRYRSRMAAVTVPIFPSTDFDQTVAFYAVLGFVEQMRWPGDYLILAHPIGVELHFWLSTGVVDPHDAAGCYVRFDTVDEVANLYREWEGLGVADSHLRALVAADYGLLEFALLDPHNNQIRFGGPVDGGR